MSLQSITSWASRRALLAALLCAQVIAGVVTVAAVGSSSGAATDADHTNAVFRSAHAGSCLTWQPEPPQRPAFVQCSTPHLFEVVNSVEGDGDQESCAVSGRRYLGTRYDPNGRFAYGLLRSVGPEGSGGRISLCGLQLPGPNGQQLPFRGLVAEQDQSRVWAPGTCLGADMKGGQTGLVPVDCDEPHSVEVVGPIDLGAHFHDAAAPSDAEQEAVLRPACVTMAAAYLAPKTLSSTDLTLNHRPIGPASWAAGSRQVLCSLAPRTPGPMTGSIKAPAAAPAAAPVVAAAPAPVAVTPAAPRPVAAPAPVTTATTVAPTTNAQATVAAVAPSTAASTAPPSSVASQAAEATSAPVTDTPAPPASPVENPVHAPQAPPVEQAPPAEAPPPAHVFEIPGMAPIILPWPKPPL